MKKPLFSIIIPVYKVEQYLQDCIDSILNQGFDNIELVCINDGSPDNCLRILQSNEEKYPEIIRVYSQDNAGLSAARNKGVEIATGDYLLFLDSDDLLNMGSINKLAQLVEAENPDIIAFNSELYYAAELKSVANEGFNHNTNLHFSSGLDYFNYFVGQRGWGPSAACFYLYKRKLFEDNQLQFKPGLLHEDELFMPLVLFYAQNTLVINETIYKYRMHDGSIIHNVSTKNLNDKLQISKELFSFYEAKDIDKKFIYRNIFNLIFSVFNFYLTDSQIIKPDREISMILRKVSKTYKEKLESFLLSLDFRLYKLYKQIKS